MSDQQALERVPTQRIWGTPNREYGEPPTVNMGNLPALPRTRRSKQVTKPPPWGFCGLGVFGFVSLLKTSSLGVIFRFLRWNGPFSRAGSRGFVHRGSCCRVLGRVEADGGCRQLRFRADGG